MTSNSETQTNVQAGEEALPAVIGSASKTEQSEPVMWPSERIPEGGIFHAPKITYSKETHDLLKLLMKESKMSMMMRKQIDYHLRNGEPLPAPTPPPPINTNADPDKNALEILQRARNAKRKSLGKIMASGAYDMPTYRPKPDGRQPAEKAKLMLQETMAGMPMADANVKAKRKQKPKDEHISTTEETINELLDQINERADWLAEMEELGEGKRYRDEIREQIAERLRHIRSLQNKINIQKAGYRYVE